MTRKQILWYLGVVGAVLLCLLAILGIIVVPIIIVQFAPSAAPSDPHHIDLGRAVALVVSVVSGIVLLACCIVTGRALLVKAPELDV